MNAAGEPPIHADFPIELRANDGHLLITALMPMEEYIAGVLAGETGNFKSDEALKAMAVAARTFAIHFGSRHAIDGFDFCDTTHCQDLRLAGIDPHLRRIADSTAGEILVVRRRAGVRLITPRIVEAPPKTAITFWVTMRLARLISRSIPINYCVRNGGTQWHTEVSKRDLQRALAADGHHHSRNAAISGSLAPYIQRTSRICSHRRQQQRQRFWRWNFAPPSAATLGGTA